jgi:hypothetical protein
MGLGEWLKGFRAQHQQARQGTLSAEEQKSYRAARDELARALLVAQHVMVKPGEVARRQLRVARALQVEIDFGKEKVRAMTLDVSAGGFGALLARSPVPGDQMKFSLRLPGQDPLAGVVQVMDVKVQPGNARAAFAFRGLPERELERLETFVFDAVLEQLG